MVSPGSIERQPGGLPDLAFLGKEKGRLNGGFAVRTSQAIPETARLGDHLEPSMVAQRSRAFSPFYQAVKYEYG